MKCKISKLLLYSFLFGFSLLGYRCNAQSVSSSAYFYNQYWNISQGHSYTSGYDSNISCGSSVGNSTYCFIPGGSGSTTGFIRQIYVNPQYSFVANHNYKITLKFGHGSYLPASYTLYSFTQNIQLSYCGATSSTNQLSTCSIQWTHGDSSNSYISTATIYYSPTASSSSAYFQIGSIDNNNQGVMINTYSNIQGIRIDSADVTEDDSGTSAIINNQNSNTQSIINNNNQNTQDILDSQNDIKNEIEIINDELGNTSISSQLIEDAEERINVINTTPISDLFLLPINILNSINTGLSSVCKSYTIPFDFTGGNNTLTFPCLNLENYLGSDIWTIIDDLFCIFMFYNIVMLFIHFIEDWTSLKDTFDIQYKGGAN